MKKYQNELLHVIAQHAIDSADLKSLLADRYSDSFDYASGLTDNELEEHCEDLGIDFEPYLNTGEDT